MIRACASLFIGPAKIVFCLCAQATVLSSIREIRVAIIMIVMDGRVFRRWPQRWQAADDVWGPGSWGRRI